MTVNEKRIAYTKLAFIPAVFWGTVFLFIEERAAIPIALAAYIFTFWILDRIGNGNVH